MNSEKIIMRIGVLLTVLIFGLTDASSEPGAHEMRLTLSSEVRETPVFVPVEVEFRLANLSDRTVEKIPYGKSVS